MTLKDAPDSEIYEVKPYTCRYNLSKIVFAQIPKREFSNFAITQPQSGNKIQTINLNKYETKHLLNI